jgi:outer membrane protein OmpA-like peptidoglycan-associated protein
MQNNTITKLVIFLALITNITLASAANNALKFSHGKYVELDAFEMGGSLTFSSWVKFDKATSWSRVFDFGDGRNSNINALMVGLEDSSKKLVFYSFDKDGKYTEVSDGDNAKSFGKVPVDGSWVHVVATINDAGNARMYANGFLIGSKDNAYVPPMSVRKYGYLGNSAWDNNYSDLEIDNFGIWKRALSAKEVESLYLDGISGVSNPDYYWNFDKVNPKILIPTIGNIKGKLINMNISDWTLSNVDTFMVQGVSFPQGPISFADKVIDYKPGTGVESPHDDMNVAVGLPGNTGNFCDASVCNEVSLGVHGTIITQFIDNYLTTSGDDSLDLWIFETGSAVEATKVDVSVNGKDWIDVGSVEGATSGVDIDAFKDNGIVEDIKYRYVRLTDLKGESSRPYQGADIDAVGAISAATKEIRDLVKTIEENNFVDFDIAFEGNHWRLQDDIRPELDKLGEVLSAHAFSKGSFELVGHVAGKGGMHKVCIDSKHKVVNNSRFAMECWDTDNAWAQTLSERRAQSVRDYLLKNFTIPAGRIKAYGVGHSQHKFNNPDDAGNRRVEVKYTKQ